jgi:hypothetical protein
MPTVIAVRDAWRLTSNQPVRRAARNNPGQTMIIDLKRAQKAFFNSAASLFKKAPAEPGLCLSRIKRISS